MNRAATFATRTLGIAGIVTLSVTTFLACSGPQPQPQPIPDETEEPVIQEEEPVPAPPPPPILTVDDVYSAITLSVQAGDPEAAIAAYAEAELERPDEPGTRVLLANLYLIAGEIGQAQTILEEVLASEPENTDALFLSSLLSASVGDKDRQRGALEQLLGINPANPRALAALGELQLADRDYDAAAASFEDALDADSENLVARVGLANVYLREEEYEAAEDELSIVIDSDPEYAFPYADRARARALQRELHGAVADLTIAIELDAEYQWHFIDRGRVYLEQSRFEQAESDFSAALQLDDGQFITHVLRGRARDALGDISGALTDYEAGLALRPDYYPAYEPTATLLYMSGRGREAGMYFGRAFESDERRLELILMTALAYKSAGEAAIAEDWLNDHLSSLPRESVLYQVARYYLLPTNDGYILAEIGREQNARLKGQMYFYLGAQLALIERHATAQASLLEAEDAVPRGLLERRLASWHLDAYRSGNPNEEGD